MNYAQAGAAPAQGRPSPSNPSNPANPAFSNQLAPSQWPSNQGSPNPNSANPNRAAGNAGYPGGGASPSSGALVDPNHPNQSQQHLGQWIEAHRNLPLAQQQSALENERGFRQLPPQMQQRMHNRLTQLNNMPPERQQQVIARTEAMEHLAPAQRQQVRDALAGVGVLPEDRRHVVSRTFFQLRDLPPEQRAAYMNSPQFRSQFNDQERGALNNLLNVAPMYPPLQATPGRQASPR